MTKNQLLNDLQQTENQNKRFHLITRRTFMFLKDPEISVFFFDKEENPDEVKKEILKKWKSFRAYNLEKRAIKTGNYQIMEIFYATERRFLIEKVDNAKTVNGLKKWKKRVDHYQSLDLSLRYERRMEELSHPI